jgi:molecular chaperone GrpE
MADEEKKDSEVAELDLDGGDSDLESVMRAAVAAVEGVESGAGVGAAGSSAADAEAADLAEVGKLRREIADLRDRSMRTLADFDNFRKRSERERQDAKRYALMEPVRDFLTVVDNLERALNAQGSSDDLNQFQDQLRRYGVKEISAKGEAFDPGVHEAVMRQEDPAVSRPTVMEEFQRGYMMHDRLLRPAMVKVGVPAEKATAPGAAGAGGAGDAGGTGGNGGIPIL